MDLMSIRRGLLMGMAQGTGIADTYFELVRTIHVEQTTGSIITDAFPEGFYVVIASPLMTKQDGIDLNTYAFKAGQFEVYVRSAANIANGQTYYFNNIGQSDYWGMSVIYTDETKQHVLIRGNSGENVKFVAEHDLLIFRAKGD